MKKIASLMIIMALCLLSIDPQIAKAAVKISKAKAVMEVDSTLKLKILGTDDDIAWSTSKKTIAAVSSTGTVMAKSEGQATITAKVSSKKYTCKVTVVDSNKQQAEPVVKTILEFEEYINQTYSSIKTSMGTIKLRHTISENDSEVFAYDCFIKTEWDGVEPYDMEYSISYTDSEKESTKKKLRDIQKNIYNDFICSFPSKKATGAYLYSWYEYPAIMVGYKSIRFLSWCNYIDNGDIYAYKTSKLGDFRWTPEYDDYDFTE